MNLSELSDSMGYALGPIYLKFPLLISTLISTFYEEEVEIFSKQKFHFKKKITSTSNSKVEMYVDFISENFR